MEKEYIITVFAISLYFTISSFALHQRTLAKVFVEKNISLLRV